MNTKNDLKDKGPDDLELRKVIAEREAAELKKIIDNKDKAIEELTKKINGTLDNLRKNGL